MKKIKFVGNEIDDLTFKPEKSRNTFYQICQFKNPYTELYGTRKVIFNENYDIIQKFEKEYSIHKLRKFMKKNSEANKYRVYPVNDINYIDIPNNSDLMMANSDLINRNVDSLNKTQDKNGFDSFNDMMFGSITNNGNNFAMIEQNKHAKRTVHANAPNKNNLSLINNNLV